MSHSDIPSSDTGSDEGGPACQIGFKDLHKPEAPCFGSTSIDIKEAPPSGVQKLLNEPGQDKPAVEAGLVKDLTNAADVSSDSDSGSDDGPGWEIGFIKDLVNSEAPSSDSVSMEVATPSGVKKMRNEPGQDKLTVDVKLAEDNLKNAEVLSSDSDSGSDEGPGWEIGFIKDLVNSEAPSSDSVSMEVATPSGVKKLLNEPGQEKLAVDDGLVEDLKKAAEVVSSDSDSGSDEGPGWEIGFIKDLVYSEAPSSDSVSMEVATPSGVKMLNEPGQNKAAVDVGLVEDLKSTAEVVSSDSDSGSDEGPGWEIGFIKDLVNSEAPSSDSVSMEVAKPSDVKMLLDEPGNDEPAVEIGVTADISDSSEVHCCDSGPNEGPAFKIGVDKDLASPAVPCMDCGSDEDAPHCKRQKLMGEPVQNQAPVETLVVEGNHKAFASDSGSDEGLTGEIGVANHMERSEVPSSNAGSNVAGSNSVIQKLLQEPAQIDPGLELGFVDDLLKDEEHGKYSPISNDRGESDSDDWDLRCDIGSRSESSSEDSSSEEEKEVKAPKTVIEVVDVIDVPEDTIEEQQVYEVIDISEDTN